MVLNSAEMETLQGGVHFSEGGYDRIAVKVFNTLDVDVFYVSSFLLTSLIYF